ncbi:MAG: type II toxin-antitoxin system VapB family antitoxin [Gammaproteobacteria bacterium]
MRTTVRLDERLLAEVKQLAQASNKTLTLVVEDALREMLARRQVCQKRMRVKLTTVRGKGVRPGIDLDDSATLVEWIEASNDAAGR